MDEIINWITKYSPPIVLLIVFGAVIVYLIKQITESVISQQFDKYKKDIELKLIRRSNFEERILIDRYLLIKEIQTKIGSIMTNLNRIKHGHQIDGFIIQNDIVPLTEVFEILSASKYLITNKFHLLFTEQSQLLKEFANAKDESQIDKIKIKYGELLNEFYKKMNDMFNLESINFEQ